MPLNAASTIPKQEINEDGGITRNNLFLTGINQVKVESTWE